MSKPTLYRQPADCNPIQLSQVPKQKLNIEFPTNESFTDDRVSTWKLLFALSWLSSSAALLPISMNRGVAFVVCVLSGGLFFKVYNRKKYKSMPITAAATLGFWITAGLNRLQVTLSEDALANRRLLYLLCLLFTTWTVVEFRRHWCELSSAGMLPDTVRNDFRKRLNLPKGLMPKPGGFHRALVSYFSYDIGNTRTPGIHKSKLHANYRVALFVFTTFLIAGFVMPLGVFRLTAEANAGLFGIAAVTVCVSLVVGMTVMLVLLSMLYLFSASVTDPGYALYARQFSHHHWSPFIQKLRNSPNNVEAKSIYLGRVVGDNAPILYPADALMEHMWIQGGSGGGKTAMLAQLIEELIELSYSVITIDNKATSHELIWGAYEAADRVQKTQGRTVPIYPFTTVNRMPSFLIDLYGQPFWQHRSPEEKASGILGVFGLNYPSVYGQDWFRDTSWAAMQHTSRKYPNIRSFHEYGGRLAQELQYAKEWELSKKVREAADHPRLMLDRVGLVDAANRRPTFSPDVLSHAVNFERFFTQPSVLHCALPSEVDPIGNPEVGRLVLAALFSSAASMVNRPVKVVVIIDEFQKMISRSLDTIIQQARSSDVGLIFANQVSSDLKLPDCDLIGTLAGNTSIQAWLKTPDPAGREHIIKTGGQYIDHLFSVSRSSGRNGVSVSRTSSEHVFDRVTTGLIDEVDASQDLFFLNITKNAGYAAYGSQLFVARSTFHISSIEHRLRSKPLRWPAKKVGMLVNGEHRPGPQGPSQAALTGPKPSPPPKPIRKSSPLGPARSKNATP